MALAWTVRSNIVFKCFSLSNLIPLSVILYKHQTMLIIEVESAILKSSSETTQFGVNLRQRIRSSIPLNRESRIESEKSRIPRDCASWPPIHDENVFPRFYTLITLFSMVLYANSVFLIVLSFIRKLWL